MGSGSGSGGTGGTGGPSDGCGCVGRSPAAPWHRRRRARGGGYISFVVSWMIDISGSLITTRVFLAPAAPVARWRQRSLPSDPGAGYDPCGSCNDHRYAWNVSGSTCDDRWCCHYLLCRFGRPAAVPAAPAREAESSSNPRRLPSTSGVTIDALRRRLFHDQRRHGQNFHRFPH